MTLHGECMSTNVNYFLVLLPDTTLHDLFISRKPATFKPRSLERSK